MSVFVPPTVTERAYIAGFVDGEGCIGLHHKSDIPSNGRISYGPYLAITNSDLPILEWIQKKTRGGVIAKGIYNGVNAKDRNVLKYQVDQMTRILEYLRPYLIVKARQADLLLEYLKTKGERGRRIESEELYARRAAISLELSLLNKRGL